MVFFPSTHNDLCLALTPTPAQLSSYLTEGHEKGKCRLGWSDNPQIPQRPTFELSQTHLWPISDPHLTQPHSLFELSLSNLWTLFFGHPPFNPESTLQPEHLLNLLFPIFVNIFYEFVSRRKKFFLCLYRSFFSSHIFLPWRAIFLMFWSVFISIFFLFLSNKFRKSDRDS